MSDHTVSNPQSANMPSDFLSVQDEARAFWQSRYRIIRTVLHQLATEARFRLSLVVLLSTLLWCGLFWLFSDGFAFLQTGIRDPEMHDIAVRSVFANFFLALMIMLFFSSAIILYGSLFRSPEIPFLLTMPARTGRVFLHKFQESIVLSSWGFLLLGSPMLLAYGVVSDAPWYYFAMLLPFMIGFVYIPAAIGAILCLAIMYWLPGRRLLLLLLAAIATIIVTVVFVWSLAGVVGDNLLTPRWFQEMLSRLQFAQRRWLPSWWLSSGLLQAARNQSAEGVLFLTLVISNALFLRQIAVWIAELLYRPAYSLLHGGRRSTSVRSLESVVSAIVAASRRIAKGLDQISLRGLFCVPWNIRLLLVKDSRIFRRDPMQWSQFVIFIGLLVLYFLNIRGISYRDRYVGWVNMIAFLNLSVVGLLMSTFTTRFIYPMISLEGKRFWFLGLLPVRREQILWGKFTFAVGASVIPCGGLILLSDCMLGVPGLIIASHQLTCVILCVGLSGIAVGLGARLPNLREQSPAKIAAGFGGTLNLVVSTIYILAIVMLTALPSHFYLAALASNRLPAPVKGFLGDNLGLNWVDLWLALGTSGSILLGIIATVVPLQVGFRAFRRLEF